MSKKTFNVNSILYPEIIIQEAILAFDGYDISMNSNAITIDDEDPQYIFDEFMNYSLSLSLENSIWA